MSKRDEIVRAARSWIGVPYRHLGRDRGGVDCVGLIIKVAHECGLSTYDTTNYPRRPHVQDFMREMRGHLSQIPMAEVKAGDVLVFLEPRHPCHVGVVDEDAGGAWVIHSYAIFRKVVRERLAGERLQRAVMAFRYAGV